MASKAAAAAGAGGADTADGADGLDRRTVFVRDISYDASVADVQAAFEEVGPVRSCFLVGGDKGAKHRGCGYVKFALPEDAERALATLAGARIAGRPVRVELARKRATFEQRKRGRGGGEDGDGDDGGCTAAAAAAPATRPSPQPRAAAPRTPRTPEAKAAAAAKHKLVRTVALGNLTPDTVDAALARARSAGGAGVEEVTHPAPADAVSRAGLARDGCAGGVAFITYASVKDAMAAVANLHGATVEGAGPDGGGGAPPLSKKAKKKAAAAAAGGANAPAPPMGLGPSTVLWARQVSGEGALLKKWRLIIRNLAFSVDEAALRALLAPAGFVWELNIPRRPDGSPRGFAFAGFTCRAHAAKAIALANAVVLGGRPIAVDWAVGKAAFSAATAAAGADGGGGGEDADPPGASDSDGAGGDDAGPTFAGDDDEGDDEPAEVDVAAEQRLLKGVLDQLADGGGDDDGGATTTTTTKKGKKATAADDAKIAEDAAAAKAARAAAAAAEREARVRAAAASLAASGAGVDATVFVRGLPADATPGALRTRLEAFGDVKACRLVMDKKTGRPKGTAFVEFTTEAGAAAAAAAAERAAAGDGPPVCVGGTPVALARALTQDGARALATARGSGGADGALAGPAASKPDGGSRNLYLAKEGAIEPGSGAWEGLSAADRALRARAAAEMRTKLKSPNFAVSRTRLCLRNLPFAVDEAALKPLLLKAVTDRASKATPRLVQVKVLRGGSTRGDKPAAAAAAKSRGMAFAEFADHEHALCALRQLNNSPAPFGPDRRPVVEFAVDDARALHKRARAAAAREAAAATAKAAAKAAKASGADGDANAPAKKSRAARRKERKLREAAAAAGEEWGGGAAAAGPDRPAKRARRGPQQDDAPAPASPAPRQRKGGAKAAKPADDGPAAAPATAAARRQPLKKNKKRSGGGDEATDRLDDLVAAYRTKLFAGAGGGGGKGASLDRWM